MLEAKTGADATGETKTFDFQESRLPTASGCHFQEAETSERRRFGAALGQATRATAPQITTLAP
jgi:hypothetical protein